MFIFNRRSHILAAVVLFMPATTLADRLVMKNGDVITGNVSAIVDDEVRIEPAYADEFAVDLAEVATVEIEEIFDVELADESKMSGQIALDGDRQVLLVDGEATTLNLADIAEATEPEAYFDWGAKVDFTSTINSGNTDSRNTILFAAGDVKHGDHRHLADITFRREETDDIQTKEQDLFNYAYNWMFNDPWYMGGSFSFERDPIRELEHRYTASLIVGRDIFNDATKFLTFNAGVGYSDEEIGGNTESGEVFTWNLRYTHSLWSGNIDFFHNHNFTQQLYGVDNAIFKSNTGIAFDIVSDLYATISFRYDYESDPAEDAFKDDSTLQMGLGYSF